MVMVDAIETAIQDTATGPASASVDGASANAQDIDKQIKADQYLGANAAASKNHLGLRFFKLESPGAG
jgi:hypothetical protein